jgi:hypothetical protein
MNTTPSSKMNSTTNTTNASVPMTTNPNNPSSGRTLLVEQTATSQSLQSSIQSSGAFTTTSTMSVMSGTPKIPSTTLLQNWHLLPPYVQ